MSLLATPKCHVGSFGTLPRSLWPTMAHVVKFKINYEPLCNLRLKKCHKFSCFYLFLLQVLLHHPSRPAPTQRVQVRHHLLPDGRPLRPLLGAALCGHQADRDSVPGACGRGDLSLSGQPTWNFEVITYFPDQLILH